MHHPQRERTSGTDAINHPSLPDRWAAAQSWKSIGWATQPHRLWDDTRMPSKKAQCWGSIAMFKHKQLVFPVPCFLCSHYLAKLGPIEKEAAVFGEQLSSSHWARELSSLLSTSVAAWLKTQRDGSIFFSTNTFSPKPRNNSAVNGLLQTEPPGYSSLSSFLMTWRCAIFKYLPCAIT